MPSPDIQRLVNKIINQPSKNIVERKEKKNTHKSTYLEVPGRSDEETMLSKAKQITENKDYFELDGTLQKKLISLRKKSADRIIDGEEPFRIYDYLEGFNSISFTQLPDNKQPYTPRIVKPGTVKIQKKGDRAIIYWRNSEEIGSHTIDWSTLPSSIQDFLLNAKDEKTIVKDEKAASKKVTIAIDDENRKHFKQVAEAFQCYPIARITDKGLDFPPTIPDTFEPEIAALQYLRGALLIAKFAEKTKKDPKKIEAEKKDTLKNKGKAAIPKPIKYQNTSLEQVLVYEYMKLTKKLSISDASQSDSFIGSTSEVEKQDLLFKQIYDFRDRVLPQVLAHFDIPVKIREITTARDWSLQLIPGVSACTVTQNTFDDQVEIEITRPLKQSREAILQNLFSPLETEEIDSKDSKKTKPPIIYSKAVIGKNTGNWLINALKNQRFKAITIKNKVSPPPSLRSSSLKACAYEEIWLRGTVSDKKNEKGFVLDEKVKAEKPAISIKWNKSSIKEFFNEKVYKFPKPLSPSSLSAPKKPDFASSGDKEFTAEQSFSWRRFGTTSRFAIPLEAATSEARVNLATNDIREELIDRLERAITDHLYKYGDLYDNGSEVEINLLFLRLLSPLSIDMAPDGFFEDDNLLFLQEEAAAINIVKAELRDYLLKNKLEVEVPGDPPKTLTIKPELRNTNNPINKYSFISKTRNVDVTDSEKLMHSTSALALRLSSKLEGQDKQDLINFQRYIDGKVSVFGLFDITLPNLGFLGLTNVSLSNPPDFAIMNNLAEGKLSTLDKETQKEFLIKMRAAIQLKRANTESLLGIAIRNVDNFFEGFGIWVLPVKALKLTFGLVDKVIGFAVGAVVGGIETVVSDNANKNRNFFSRTLTKLNDDFHNDNIIKFAAEATCSDNSSDACKSARDRTGIGGCFLYVYQKMAGQVDDPNERSMVGWKTDQKVFQGMKRQFAHRHFLHALGNTTTQSIKVGDVAQKEWNLPLTTVSISITPGTKYKELAEYPEQISMMKDGEKTSKDQSSKEHIWHQAKQLAKAIAAFVLVGAFLTACIFSGGLLAAGTAGGLLALASVTGGTAAGLVGTVALSTIILGLAGDLIRRLGEKISNSINFVNKNRKYVAIALSVAVFITLTVLTGGLFGVGALAAGGVKAALVLAAQAVPAFLGWGGIATLGGAILSAMAWVIPQYKTAKQGEKNANALHGKVDPEMPHSGSGIISKGLGINPEALRLSDDATPEITAETSLVKKEDKHHPRQITSDEQEEQPSSPRPGRSNSSVPTD